MNCVCYLASVTRAASTRVPCSVHPSRGDKHDKLSLKTKNRIMNVTTLQRIA